MMKYEMLYILSTKLDDEAKEAVIAKFEGIVKNAGGTVESTDKWGVKKLAYAINFKKEGYYVLFEYEANASVPQKISALMNIDENVLRSLCLKKDEKDAK